MPAIKTVITDASVAEFINAYADTVQKRQDIFELIEICKVIRGMSRRFGFLSTGK
jgi:hypothetical protein